MLFYFKSATYIPHRLLFSGINRLAFTAKAADITSGDYVYSLSNSEATITKYIGSEKDIVKEIGYKRFSAKKLAVKIAKVPASSKYRIHKFIMAKLCTQNGHQHTMLKLRSNFT